MRTNRNRIEFEQKLVRRHPLTDTDRADLPQIASRHEIARQLGFPVPQVLELRHDHLVLERMPGEPLMTARLSQGAHTRLGAQLADLLAGLRAVREWPLPVTDWPGLWRRLDEAAGTAATGRAARVAATVAVTLTHGDLSAGNLLVTGSGTLTAVLDWDGATLADPAQDYSALCANVPSPVAAEITARTPGAAEFTARASDYMATWEDQHRLWLAGEHPWIDQDSP